MNIPSRAPHRNQLLRTVNDARAFAEPYGPWGLVAGASEGLGAAFAHALASRGVNVAIVARREEKLQALAQDLVARHGIEARVIVADLSREDAVEGVARQLEGRIVGLLVYNAAASNIGPFLDAGAVDHARAVAVNCSACVKFTHHFANPMVERGRGGIVLMSSLAGFQGSPWIASYAATKAFITTLGEALWEEFGQHGVDVTVCAAGATRTPNFEATQPQSSAGPSAMLAETVAEEALNYLGKGPLMIPGRNNRVASFVMRRLLPRRTAIRIMGRSLRRMYQKNGGP